MTFECKELRDLARGQPCQANVPGVCNYDDSTSVWCHSDEQRHGKGKGIKAADPFGAICCSACHHWMHTDRIASRSEKQAVFRDAFESTLLFLWSRGLIAVAKRGHLPAARRREPTVSSLPKILPRYRGRA